MFSSSEVYGTPDEQNIPTKEEYVGSVTTFGNRSCYDIGKNVLETLCYVYHDKHNTPVNVTNKNILLCGRCGCVYAKDFNA